MTHLYFFILRLNSSVNSDRLINVRFLIDSDVYLAGTVMLIFGMGLYGLFISNVPPDVPPTIDRALKGSSLFGMFALKVISSPCDAVTFSISSHKILLMMLFANKHSTCHYFF